MHRIYLGLGSNLGDRRGYLDAAAAALPPAASVLRRSPIYETAPWGYLDQPAFLNQVFEAETSLEPLELLSKLKEIESKLGRQARFRNGPREIDIDILLYDDLVLNEGSLQIPHPRLHERAFMLAPLADLEPGLKIPGLEHTMHDYLAQLDRSEITIFADGPKSMT
jgi:2-amino-4-hydroxy-6-hydroxymethyldihydropteridine diphosphokinase